MHGDLEGASAKDMQERAEDIRASVSLDHLARFDRLMKQGLAVVSITSGTCTGCNISIPKGDLNRIASGKLEPVCPHCARFVQLDPS